MTPSDLTDRLRDKIQVNRHSWCWVWTAAVKSGGYGNVYYQQRNWLAHRLVYTLLAGEIPAGLQLDHICKNTLCVNPEHLEPVTGSENNRRSNSRSARQARRTHCPLGHPLSGDNLYIHNNHRDCLQCRRRRTRESKERRTATAA